MPGLGGAELVVLSFAFVRLERMIVRLCGGLIPGLGAPDSILAFLSLITSNVDPRFNADFMLTYRRFAAPRNVLLAIIRHLRSIEGEEKDRAILIIGDYLLQWTQSYPTDFAAPGAIPPLGTLIRYVLLDI